MNFKTIKSFLIGGCILMIGNSCMPIDRIYPNIKAEEGNGMEGDRPYYPEKPFEPGDIKDGHAPEGYTLVWQDSFDSPSSLSTKWTFENGGSGWGNDELQYYCAHGIYAPTGQKTAKVEDGNLVITAYKVEPDKTDNDNRSYVSARMNSISTWKYGYIEMRAKLPTIGGAWPAFWMLSKDGHYDVSTGGGEIDIMEWVANEPITVWFSAHSRYVTGDQPGRYKDPVTGKEYRHTNGATITDPGTEYHCFGLEWTHEYVKAYLDGVEYCYCPNPKPNVKDDNFWPFDKEYRLKLNLAVGGSWGGAVDPAFESAEYTIDWVRVFQK